MKHTKIVWEPDSGLQGKGTKFLKNKLNPTFISKMLFSRKKLKRLSLEIVVARNSLAY